MTLGPFSVGRLPRIEFGAGRFSAVPDIVARHGRRVLVATGGRSFRATERWTWLVRELDRRGMTTESLAVTHEPTLDDIDAAVDRFRPAGIEVVLGIGGGSVLDAAKAVAGLLRTRTGILDHLEAVGRGLPYEGPSVPFVAVPTTAGTGSEATRNAVVTARGRYKRSFRDERLVATDAVVDPDLLIGLSPDDIAANGMDAVAQLLESYVSTGARPFTDALAISGLAAARDALLPWHESVGGSGPPDASVVHRTRMAWASLASGICLAHAGLGVVHGLAAPLGAYFPIRHGAACGAILAAGVEANVAALAAREPANPALERFADVGRLLAGVPPDTPAPAAHAALATTLREWMTRLAIPGLGSYGVTEAGIEGVVAESRPGSMRTNPIVLTDEELAGVVRSSL